MPCNAVHLQKPTFSKDLYRSLSNTRTNLCDCPPSSRNYQLGTYDTFSCPTASRAWPNTCCTAPMSSSCANGFCTLYPDPKSHSSGIFFHYTWYNRGNILRCISHRFSLPLCSPCKPFLLQESHGCILCIRLTRICLSSCLHGIQNGIVFFDKNCICKSR